MVGVNFFLTSSPILDLGHFSQMILPIVLLLCPNYQVLFTASDGWGFFFDLFSHSGLRAFFTSDFSNCTTVYAQPSGAVHSSIWWLGLIFFFDLFSHSGLRAFFTSDFANCPTDYAPTIRCCSEHVMVGGFFLTSSPILDLGHFSQLILPLVLQIMPQPKNNPNHQVLFTASDGWG